MRVRAFPCAPRPELCYTQFDFGCAHTCAHAAARVYLYTLRRTISRDQSVAECVSAYPRVQIRRRVHRNMRTVRVHVTNEVLARMWYLAPVSCCGNGALIFTQFRVQFCPHLRCAGRSELAWPAVNPFIFHDVRSLCKYCPRDFRAALIATTPCAV